MECSFESLASHVHAKLSSTAFGSEAPSNCQYYYNCLLNFTKFYFVLNRARPDTVRVKSLPASIIILTSLLQIVFGYTIATSDLPRYNTLMGTHAYKLIILHVHPQEVYDYQLARFYMWSQTEYHVIVSVYVPTGSSSTTLTDHYGLP